MTFKGLSSSIMLTRTITHTDTHIFSLSLLFSLLFSSLLFSSLLFVEWRVLLQQCCSLAQRKKRKRFKHARQPRLQQDRGYGSGCSHWPCTISYTGAFNRRIAATRACLQSNVLGPDKGWCGLCALVSAWRCIGRRVFVHNFRC